MQLVIKNNQLVTLVAILSRVQPKSMPANRGRAKLFAKAQKRLEEYLSDEADILKDYVEIDGKGQFIYSEDGSLKPKDTELVSSLNGLLKELGDETIVLKSGEYAKRYMDFLDWLEAAEDDFSAEEIVLIDSLLDQYETSKQKKGE